LSERLLSQIPNTPLLPALFSAVVLGAMLDDVILLQ